MPAAARLWTLSAETSWSSAPRTGICGAAATRVKPGREKKLSSCPIPSDTVPRWNSCPDHRFGIRNHPGPGQTQRQAAEARSYPAIRGQQRPGMVALREHSRRPLQSSVAHERLPSCESTCLSKKRAFSERGAPVKTLTPLRKMAYETAPERIRTPNLRFRRPWTFPAKFFCNKQLRFSDFPLVVWLVVFAAELGISGAVS